MRVLGFMTLFYGKEYLRESLLSVRDHVDHMVIAYTRNPSHGHGTTAVNPDTEKEMYDIANDVLGNKFSWDVSDRYSNEGEHRNRKYVYTSGYDLCLTIDADEVFKEDEIRDALHYAYLNKERYYGIKGYQNFWRSFNHVCLDGFRPIRIENLLNEGISQNIECPLTIYHFSTCQSEAIMRYKYKIFGHASEIKPDWLDKTYFSWTPENDFGDLHCVSKNLWNAIPFDKTKLPVYLKQHPNYEKYLV